MTVVEPTLFASLEPPRLAGSRCAICSTVVFPVAGSCPKCSSSQVEPIELPDRGAIWSWTVQNYRPKTPYILPGDQFEPYAVGYVDLGEVIVESLLLGSHAELRIGLPVQLAMTRAWADDNGETLTYAFEAAGA